MSHTKGKLRFDGPEVYRVEDGTQVCFIEPVFPIEDCEDDAHRLVACWNALDGVPTEWLENYVGAGLKNIIQQNSDLIRKEEESSEKLIATEEENVTLKAENEKLRKDAERLAWMEAHPRLGQIHVDGEVKDCYLYAISGALGVPLRAIIDAAMKPEGKL